MIGAEIALILLSLVSPSVPCSKTQWSFRKAELCHATDLQARGWQHQGKLLIGAAAPPLTLNLSAEYRIV